MLRFLKRMTVTTVAAICLLSAQGCAGTVGDYHCEFSGEIGHDPVMGTYGVGTAVCYPTWNTSSSSPMTCTGTYYFASGHAEGSCS